MKAFSSALGLLAALTLSAPLFAEKESAATEAVPAGVLGSSVFNWDKMEVKKTPVGEIRVVAKQRTATLEQFECHITTLNAGLFSHPAHQHPQEECIVLKEGTVEANINGKSHRLGAGSVFFFASYDWHNVHNVGDTPATYLVFNFSTPLTAKIPKVPAAESARTDVLPSSVFDWEKLTVKKTAFGAHRDIADARTVTSKNFEAHVTTLNPGQRVHPPKRQPQEEIIAVKDGTVEVTVNGKPERIGAGSICFVASNDEFGIKNIGETSASYYVFRITTDETPKVALK